MKKKSKKEKLTVAQKRRQAVERYNSENKSEENIKADKNNIESASISGSKKLNGKKGKLQGKDSKKKKKIICIVIAAIMLVVIVAAVCIKVLMGKEMFGGYDVDKYGEVVLDAKLDGVFTCLLVASDKGGSNTDTIMLLVMRDKDKKQIDLISIPRDTRIKNPYGNGYVKINSIFARSGGKINALVEQVRNLTGIPINDFMFVNIEAVKKTVDMFGGVDFDVPMDMDYEDSYQGLYIHLKKGMQKIDGDKAEQLLRYRYGYANADLGRTQVQRDFMIAAFKQHAKASNLGKLSKWYSEMDGYIQTQLKYEDAYNIAAVATKYDFELVSRILPGTVITGSPDYFYDAEKINEMAKELGFEGVNVKATPKPNEGQGSSSINSKDNLMSGNNQTGFGSNDNFEEEDKIMPSEVPAETPKETPKVTPSRNPSESPSASERPAETSKPTPTPTPVHSNAPSETPKPPAETEKPNNDNSEGNSAGNSDYPDGL